MARTLAVRLGLGAAVVLAAAYFVERSGLADLPGITNDYAVASMLLAGIAIAVRGTSPDAETERTHG